MAVVKIDGDEANGWQICLDHMKAGAMQAFTRSVIEIIKRIPPGRVATYGHIGLMAGHTNGARQVVRILHTMSRKHNLPWHRVVNATGMISLPKYRGYDQQKALLQQEGIEFNDQDRIDLAIYQWTSGDDGPLAQRERPPNLN